MARLKHTDTAGLRECLLEDAVAFRDLYGRVVEGAWVELSKPVDQLAGGQPYRLYRYQLPNGHPARREGRMMDCLVLTDDNQVVTKAYVRRRAE